tara:strand:- start:133 stop:393 length:261 start_codon:yes stop_codon:yes gene_type:complete
MSVQGFFISKRRRKRMEEVINILGSLNTWLPYANLMAILMIYWGIQSIASRIESIESRIEGVERGLERQAGVLAKLGKRVYSKGKL